MMKTNIFYSHNLNDRMQIVNASGEFITRIKYYGFYINLYLLDKQYVEVYYNRYTNTLENVEILEALDERMNVYAVQVDLSDLYKK